MFNQEQIISGFQKTIGLQSNDSDFPAIDADLRESTYNEYIENLHPLFTHENFYNCVNEFGIYESKQSSINSWNSSVKYYKGDLVKQGSEIFRSLVNNNTNNSTSDTSKWLKTNLYSNYFRKRLDTAYFTAVQSVINKKIGYDGGAKSLLDNIQLYKKKGFNSDSIVKTGRFCGYKLGIIHNNINLILHKIALQLTQTQNDLKIYVYNNDKVAAIKVFTLNHSVAFDMFEHELENLVLDWTMGTGEFIIGYYEDDIDGQAIRNNISFTQMQGGCCNTESVLLWEKYKNYVAIKPFYVDANKLDLVNHTLSWDLEDEIYVSENTFGINLWFSAHCEVTDHILRQKHIFKNLIKQILVVHCLKDLVFTTQDNQVAAKVRAFAQMYEGGMKKFIEDEETNLYKEISRVSFDITGISSPCLPFDNRNKKPRFKVMG